MVLGFQGVGTRHLNASWPPCCVARSCRCSHGDIAGHAKALQGAAVVRWRHSTFIFTNPSTLGVYTGESVNEVRRHSMLWRCALVMLRQHG